MVICRKYAIETCDERIKARERCIVRTSIKVGWALVSITGLVAFSSLRESGVGRLFMPALTAGDYERMISIVVVNLGFNVLGLIGVLLGVISLKRNKDKDAKPLIISGLLVFTIFLLLR